MKSWTWLAMGSALWAGALASYKPGERLPPETSWGDTLTQVVGLLIYGFLLVFPAFGAGWMAAHDQVRETLGREVYDQLFGKKRQ